MPAAGSLVPRFTKRITCGAIICKNNKLEAPQHPNQGQVRRAPLTNAHTHAHYSGLRSSPSYIACEARSSRGLTPLTGLRPLNSFALARPAASHQQSYLTPVLFYHPGLYQGANGGCGGKGPQAPVPPTSFTANRKGPNGPFRYTRVQGIRTLWLRQRVLLILSRECYLPASK